MTFLELRDRLRENSQDYGLYYLLGNYYLDKNLEQAYLCYEQAGHYCHAEKDKAVISAAKQKLKEKGIAVPGVSVVILSYNAEAEIKLCLSSVRDSIPESESEIIVMDLCSDDGTVAALKEQQGIELIYSNAGDDSPTCYNWAIDAANPENDIYLLHNDVVVVSNAVFWLRMGLYENESVGATGSVSNCAQNYQQINEVYENPNDYLMYGMKHNIPMDCPYEQKLRLMGFSLMLKRKALNHVGEFDGRFFTGSCEDEDLSYRMIDAGYRLLLCRNSFVYHFGTESLQKKTTDYRQALVAAAEKFKEKWGFDYRYYNYERRSLIELMEPPSKDEVRILEIGCGMGATLGYIKNKYPEAQVYGIELVKEVAALGQKYLPDIIAGNIEQMEIPYPQDFFDYIICADVLEHLHDPEEIIRKLGVYLKPSGSLLASIPNIMHYSVVVDLLKGNFTYQDSGILDRTHLHFFTLNEIMAMFRHCGYQVKTVSGSRQSTELSQEDKMLYDAILRLPGIASAYNFETYQYFVKADIQKKIEREECTMCTYR